RWGFRPVEVLDALQAAYAGVTVSQIYEGSRSYDLAVVLDPAQRQTVGDIGKLMGRNGDGLAVPLGSLAT
ncbi:hypothetical protein NO135_26345, partial [Clostridioides difficile]|nr:hypothetical protein [Clostridioides difficile]